MQLNKICSAAFFIKPYYCFVALKLQFKAPPAVSVLLNVPETVPSVF
ncbi:MAG: hypothetical protein RI894_40, partial [Bacteroidota bacterium]